MDVKKCINCRWYVVMLYNPVETMCHWNWKDTGDVLPEECHYKPKRELPENRKEKTK